LKSYPTTLIGTPHFVWQPNQLRPGHAIIAFGNNGIDGTDG